MVVPVIFVIFLVYKRLYYIYEKKILFIIPILIIMFAIILPLNTYAQSNIATINGCGGVNRNLYWGTRGNEVSILQQFLKDRGFYNGNVTGYYGFGTASAVSKFQISVGIRSVGIVGPLTRQMIIQTCNGNTGGNNYDDSVPVYNFTPSSSCSSWNDGCNDCSKSSPDAPAACTLRYCFAAGKGYCKTHFDTNNNRPPVISGFSGPTVLTINQTGTWIINANDPENQQLSYNISWGDNYASPASANLSNSLNSFTQTSTFTHTYSTAGTYTVSITVTDASGQSAHSTTTVQVGSDNVVCTTEYAPVCGQPPEPACRYSNPACMIATPGPKTYSNRCVMNSQGATFLYNGQCNNGN